MADAQLPGQIEPIADGSRLTTPLWFQWFTFLQKTLVTLQATVTALQTTVTTIQNTITTLLGAWNSSFTPVLTADAGGQTEVDDEKRAGEQALRHQCFGTEHARHDLQCHERAAADHE